VSSKKEMQKEITKLKRNLKEKEKEMQRTKTENLAGK
jgi:hypothetical protein